MWKIYEYILYGEETEISSILTELVIYPFHFCISIELRFPSLLCYSSHFYYFLSFLPTSNNILLHSVFMYTKMSLERERKVKCKCKDRWKWFFCCYYMPKDIISIKQQKRKEEEGGGGKKRNHLISKSHKKAAMMSFEMLFRSILLLCVVSTCLHLYKTQAVSK